MGVIDTIGKAIKVLQKAGQIEIINELIDAQQKIIETQSDMMTLQHENQLLTEKLNDKQFLEELRNDVVILKNGYCYRKSESGQDIVYCGGCWGNGYKLIPLTTSNLPGPFYRSKKCTKCNAVYGRENSF